MKEKLGFPLHVAAKFGIEPRELSGIGLEAVEIAGLEPLAGEVFSESARLGIEEHAVDLRAKDFGIAQAVFERELEKLVIGHAAPQKIAEARGELEIIQAVIAVAGRLDAEKEMRRNQDSFERELHALIDGISLLPGHLDKVEQAVDLMFRYGPPVSPAREFGEIGAGASERVMAGCVAATKNAAITFRWRRRGWMVGTAQFDIA